MRQRTFARRFRRATIGVVVISAIFVGAAATPAWATPAQRSSWALAASTRQAALAAAKLSQLDDELAEPAPTNPAPSDSSIPAAEPTIPPADSPPAAVPSPWADFVPDSDAEILPGSAAKAPLLITPPPPGIGTIQPGDAAIVDAAPLGAQITFSGHKVDAPLAVTVEALPGDSAAKIAAVLAATVVTQPFSVTAQTASGREVTSFPADPTILVIKNGPDVVTAVDPGVALSIAVTPERLASVDPLTVRIVTRETDADLWVELPSYYDAASGTVKGESDHLSQFAVIGTPFVVPAGPRIVLDPDDDQGHSGSGATADYELKYNVRLANQVAVQLIGLCNADVLVTRTSPSPSSLSFSLRAGMAAAFNPDLTLTIGFDALTGFAWGTESDGGSKAYSRGQAADNALRSDLVATLPGFTGRPAKAASQSNLPYSAFDSLPGAVAHIEALYLDHNYDRPVIQNGFDFIGNGVTTALGQYLTGAGFDCLDPVLGGWPTRPSAAQLAQWSALGFHNFQTYGADPVSFSTGNLLETIPLFTLETPGTSTIPIALNYNSQDGRESQVGTGWSFGIGARAQRFIDGSVLIVKADGASDVYEPSGSGAYTAPAGIHDTLVDSAGSTLTLTTAAGAVSVFDTANIDGIGQLRSFTDSSGNGYTLGYGAAGADSRFVPLASITATTAGDAGQTIGVGTDSVGHIVSFTRPDGRVTGLSYGAAGDLTGISTASGTRTFSYDAAHQLITATDPMGVLYLENRYDPAGRVTQQWDAQRNLRTFTYDTNSDGTGTTSYVNNVGKTTVFAWDARSRITSVTDAAGGVESFTYDNANNTTAHTDQNGNKTRYTYDASGNVLTETNAAGALTSHTYTATGVLKSTTDTGGIDGALRTTTYEVDARGLITAAHLPGGGAIRLEYTAAGDLAATIDQAGNRTTLTRDEVSNITGITDPTGQTTTNAYDAGGRVVSRTDPSGASTTFVWDAADRLTRTVDALGAATSYTYDANDHLVSSTNALGGVSSYVWDSLFHLTTVTTPGGATTSYRYNAEDTLIGVTDPIGAITSLSVDALERPTTVTDAAGKKWRSAYDAVGNLVSTSTPDRAKTTYAYDALGQLTSIKDALGNITNTDYDEVGRTTSTTDALGQKVQYRYTVLDQTAAIVDPAGNITRYAYDAAGNTTSTIDRRGQTWLAGYDALGRLISQTDPNDAVTAFLFNTTARTVTTTNPLGSASVTAFDAAGHVTSQTDALGASRSASYDALGRATGSTNALGATTNATYDSAGNLVTRTDALGNTNEFRYDLAGRLTGAVDPAGSTTSYTYDLLSQLTKVTQNVQLPSGVGSDAEEASDANVVTKYSYTAAGLLASVTDPNGHTTSTRYDRLGRPISETNPLGVTTRTVYDALSRATARTDGEGKSTKTSYTETSDVKSVSYADGTSTTYSYDTEQNPIVMADSLGTTGWQYDATGSLTSQTDANGVTSTSSYDAAGQRTSYAIETPGAATTLSYSYDKAGNQLSQSSPFGSITNTFDAIGQLSTATRSSGNSSDYSYDATGQVTAIVHHTPASSGVAPASKAATVSPWNGSQMLEGGTPVCATKSPVASYLAARTMPSTAVSGCEKTDAYLEGRDLPELAVPVPAAATLSYIYSYDANGNVSGQTVDTGAETDTTATATATASHTSTIYNYDNLNRLTASTGSDDSSNSYAYDKAGNRTEWVTSNAPDTGKALTVSSVFDAANKLLSQSRVRPGGTTAVAYSYNQNGSRTQQQSSGAASEGTTNYTYTAAGQLATVAHGNQTVTYGYDGAGRNHTTRTDTTAISGSLLPSTTSTSTSVYDGLQIAQTTDPVTGTNTMLRDALGSVAAQSTVSHANPGSRSGTSTTPAWSLQDRAGSTIAQTIPTGTLTDTTSYSDFGVQQFATTGWNATTGYTGEKTDPTTGLNLYLSRAYDPFAGTWLSADTLRGTATDSQTQNRYAFVGNNPTTFQDLLGFKAVKKAADQPWMHMSADALEREVERNPGGVAAAAAVEASESAKTKPPKKASDSSIVSQRHPLAAFTYCDQTGCGNNTGRNSVLDCDIVKSQRGCEVLPRQDVIGFVPGRDSDRFPIGVNYSYYYADIVASTQDFTAAEVMSIFQKNPSVFPFTISGCPQFSNGAICKLIDSTGFFPVQNDTASVRVTTTSTSVMFTVVSRGYFDAPGSTVSFRTEVVDGMVRLVHEATGMNADPTIAFGAIGLNGARNVWREQADRLSKLLGQIR